MGKIHKNNNKMGQRVVTKRINRAEMVFKMAQLCLQKIRDVKAFFVDLFLQLFLLSVFLLLKCIRKIIVTVREIYCK
ncbi:hypothetical protein ARALYDRAFT_915805 [Arabidopsis lyrata subsp. lyrata]|uniref:Uncharacterized protein n=1 Tax=Arabidopsis lyrata subsp. lyrata TaxID=81972 RepID=D7MI57_ARALL|nr:hypothetical protein ARALYDRAFT_915805 [Arabidopsis lyrata subsp. lyrata]